VSSSYCAALFLAMLSSDAFCDAQLDRLLAVHRETGLPAPPPNASFVRYIPRPVVTMREGKKVTERGAAALGFSRDGRTVLDYYGDPFEVESLTVVKPDLKVLGADADLGWLEDAIEYHARGWGSLARTTFRRWAVSNNPRDAAELLRLRAWYYWRSRLYTDPSKPLAVIAKHMKQVLPGTRYDTPVNRDLIRCLELALKPRNSPPGSDDALIDDLIELAGEIPHIGADEKALRNDPRYRAIVRRGLDAVPALIAHLNDDRLTRVLGHLPWSGDRHYRVKDVALDILSELAGSEDALRKETTDATLAAIGKWFAGATKLGEEKYVVERVLGDKDDGEFRPALFWLLCEKYPERLPGVYREIIDARPGHAAHSYLFAKAVAEAPVPEADKRKVLEHAAHHKSPHHRWAGISYLRAFDPKLAHELILAGLKAIPEELTQPELQLVGIAAEGTDPNEWRALGLLVRRAVPGGRMDLLHAVAQAKGNAGRKHRLSLLAEYLTDSAERDPEDVRGTDPSHGFPRLEVRDFAAMTLAKLLDLGPEPDADWTAAQWATLREKVRAKVKDELRR
jgi:hypothetical protein